MKAYSTDLRERVVSACDAGDATREQVAARFSVSVAWIRKLMRQRRETGSYRENGEGLLLTRDDIDWFYDNWFPGNREKIDWRVSPLLAADHSRLPPALVLVAG